MGKPPRRRQWLESKNDHLLSIAFDTLSHKSAKFIVQKRTWFPIDNTRNFNITRTWPSKKFIFFKSVLPTAFDNERFLVRLRKERQYTIGEWTTINLYCKCILLNVCADTSKRLVNKGKNPFNWNTIVFYARIMELWYKYIQSTYRYSTLSATKQAKVTMKMPTRRKIATKQRFKTYL